MCADGLVALDPDAPVGTMTRAVHFPPTVAELVPAVFQEMARLDSPAAPGRAGGRRR